MNVSALKCGAYSRAAVNRVNTVVIFTFWIMVCKNQKQNPLTSANLRHAICKFQKSVKTPSKHPQRPGLASRIENGKEHKKKKNGWATG